MKHILAGMVTLCFVFCQSIFAEPVTVERVVEQYGKAVVMIATINGPDQAGLGSGFIVDSSGVVITNHHVINNANPIFIKLTNGDVYEDVLIIHLDEKRDFAVLKINGWNLPTVEVGNSDAVKIGSRLTVIGNPQGLENTVTDGLLSGIRDTGAGYKMLQISAPISSGNSGGPVFNGEGKVIGIATSSLADGQNLNFAIPVNYAMGATKNSPMGKPQDIFKSLSTIKTTLSEKIQEKLEILSDEEMLKKLGKSAAAIIEVDNLLSDVWFKRVGFMVKYKQQASLNDYYIVQGKLQGIIDLLKEVECNTEELNTYRDILLKNSRSALEGLNIYIEESKKELTYRQTDLGKADQGMVAVRIAMGEIGEYQATTLIPLLKEKYPQKIDLFPEWFSLDQEQLREIRKRIDPDLLNGVVIDYWKPNAGLYIHYVFVDSNAEDVGVKEGDRIVSINGVPMNKMMDLGLVRPDRKIGDLVTYVVERGNQQMVFSWKTQSLSKYSEKISKKAEKVRAALWRGR